MRPTRSLIDRLERSIDDPLRYRITDKRTPEAARFLAFSLVGRFVPTKAALVSLLCESLFDAACVLTRAIGRY